MLRKCKYCDEKGDKLIDTSSNKYLKIGSDYSHFDCHKIYLMTRKRGDKLKEEDALLECLRLEEITKKETMEVELKERLFNMLLEYYETPIPTNLFVKIDAIVKGKYKGISNPISYYELIDMYSNQKMMQKLERLGYDKGLKKEDRIHWDLGCMVNEYPKYVKAKLKNKALEQDSINAIENVKRYKIDRTERYSEQRKSVESTNENTAKIDDLVNDLFDIDD